jgi:hypothetical protein
MMIGVGMTLIDDGIRRAPGISRVETLGSEHETPPGLGRAMRAASASRSPYQTGPSRLLRGSRVVLTPEGFRALSPRFQTGVSNQV